VAEPYLTDLRKLAEEWMEIDSSLGSLECRHFFSGAAAYRDGTIVATLTPVGLAFKANSEARNSLLSRGEAEPLHYFPDSPIKKDYVLFSEGHVDPSKAAELILGYQE
jgi:TfoX/Sxy family transcriptional regulator of competence genes